MWIEMECLGSVTFFTRCKTARASGCLWTPKGTDVRKLTMAFLIVLLATVSVDAKPRRSVQSSGGPAPAAVEDPQAYAMRIARETWPGRALCDFGGYRIVPCDQARGF